MYVEVVPLSPYFVLCCNRPLNITKWPQNLFVYREKFICAQIRPSTWRLYLRADKFICRQKKLCGSKSMWDSTHSSSSERQETCLHRLRQVTGYACVGPQVSRNSQEVLDYPAFMNKLPLHHWLCEFCHRTDVVDDSATRDVEVAANVDVIQSTNVFVVHLQKKIS